MALIVGGSLQAFSLVLMSFIFGIGIGSLLIASSRLAKNLGIYTIYLLLIGAAILVALDIIFIEKWMIFYTQVKWLAEFNRVLPAPILHRVFWLSGARDSRCLLLLGRQSLWQSSYWNFQERQQLRPLGGYSHGIPLELFVAF